MIIEDVSATCARKIVVHVGTHKTGTTSIQQWLQDNLGLLRRNRIAFYQGLFYKNNHAELHLLSQRRERTSAFKYTHSDIDYESVRQQANKNLRTLFATLDAETFIFSSEGLSYLRHIDETARLKRLIGDPPDIEIIIYLRKKRQFLASYRSQLERMGIPLSENAGAFNYVEEDSWLVDYDSLVAAYEAVFTNVKVLSYEVEVEENSNVIPSFAAVLGLPASLGFQGYYLNST